MIKKIATVTVLTALLATGVAMAKPFGDPEKMAAWLDKRIERMTEKLSLNDDQAAKVKTIMQEQMEKRKAMMEQHRTETEARLGTVLTSEQMQKMQEMKEKRKEKRGKGEGRHGKHHGGGRCNN